MKKTILTAALVCAFLGAQAQEYYEKQVTFPVGATLEQKVDMVKVFLWTKRTGRLVRLILMHNTASLTQRL